MKRRKVIQTRFEEPSDKPFPDTIVSVDQVSDTEQVVTLTDGTTFKCHPRVNLHTVVAEMNKQKAHPFRTAVQAERAATLQPSGTRWYEESTNQWHDGSRPGGAVFSSVLQSWVMALPLREQGTLLTAVRGCDDEPKQWFATGFADSPGRRLTAFIRYCFMNPADVREVDIPGAFFQSKPPEPFRPSEFGHLPQHWYAHVMHALEVIGYRHPDNRLRSTAYVLYCQMVQNLHLNREYKPDYIIRLSEDRIKAGNVVS